MCKHEDSMEGIKNIASKLPSLSSSMLSKLYHMNWKQSWYIVQPILNFDKEEAMKLTLLPLWEVLVTYSHHRQINNHIAKMKFGMPTRPSELALLKALMKRFFNWVIFHSAHWVLPDMKIQNCNLFFKYSCLSTLL